MLHTCGRTPRCKRQDAKMRMLTIKHSEATGHGWSRSDAGALDQCKEKASVEVRIDFEAGRTTSRSASGLFLFMKRNADRTATALVDQTNHLPAEPPPEQADHNRLPHAGRHPRSCWPDYNEATHSEARLQSMPHSLSIGFVVEP